MEFPTFEFGLRSLLATRKVTATTEIHVRLVLIINFHVEGIPLLHVCDVLLVPDLEGVLRRVYIKGATPAPPPLVGEVHAAPPTGGSAV